MADSVKQKTTAKERQIARIEQLKKQLQNEEAKLRADARKERNAQLIAFGVYLEAFLRDKTDQIPTINRSMKKYLTGRNLEKGMSGMERVYQEVSKAQPKKEAVQAPQPQSPKSAAEKDGKGD